MIDYVKPFHAIHTPSTAEFQEQCLDFINEITEAEAEGRTVKYIVFGDDGPVALLTHYVEPPMPAIYGLYKGKVKILGDIVSPMPAEWFAVPDAAAASDESQ